jgi:predicted RNase H-like nuclease (RuvC/YqgF family)
VKHLKSDDKNARATERENKELREKVERYQQTIKQLKAQNEEFKKNTQSNDSSSKEMKKQSE